jgi:exopolysaccharide production protein ExoY
MAELANTRENFSSFSTRHPIGGTGKRFWDIFLACSAIVLLAPLLGICFVACLLASPGPVIYRHKRVGFGGKLFNCFKFRTMRLNSDDAFRDYLASNPVAHAQWTTSRKLQFDPRVTAIGRILRKTSLDELPQLFNVLMGDMSIVGPRPVTEDELDRYSTRTGSYLACRPGITGLWQISGRSGTSYNKRVACDAFYAQNWSLALDAKIILVTVPVLLDSENAY